jgi:hypothetical protein
VLPQHQHISLFFHMRGDPLLHGTLSLIFQSPMEDPTVSFTISNPRVCLRALLCILLPPKGISCFMAWSLMTLKMPCLVPYEHDSHIVPEKAQWVNYLMVVANYYGDSPLSWVGVFSWLC